MASVSLYNVRFLNKIKFKNMILSLHWPHVLPVLVSSSCLKLDFNRKILFCFISLKKNTIKNLNLQFSMPFVAEMDIE